MVRNYSRTTKKFTEEDIKNALDKILKDKESVVSVAKSSGIPKTSLYRYIKLHRSKKKKFIKQIGRHPALNESEELDIVKVCGAAAELGWAIDRNDVADIISKYCLKMERKTQFRNNYPSKDFKIIFLRNTKGHCLLERPQL